MKLIFCLFAAAIPILAAADEAKMLPDGPGKELAAHICMQCHDSSNFREKRVDGEAWTDIVGRMVDQGAQATDEQQATIVDYLVQNFGPGSKVRINTAPFSEIRVVLKLTNEETKAIIAYREEHGDFKDLHDLLKVPGLDSQKVEAKKEMLAF